jgi:hypothetical protein
LSAQRELKRKKRKIVSKCECRGHLEKFNLTIRLTEEGDRKKWLEGNYSY